MTLATTRALARTAAVLSLVVMVAGCGSAPAGQSGAEAKTLLLEAGETPEGFRVARGQQRLGQPEFCGISLVPKTVHDRAFRRYAQSAVGPFLYQYVFIGSSQAVRGVTEDLSAELATCSRYTVRTEEGARVPFGIRRLERLPTYGQSSVGFRVDPRGEVGVPAEYVVIRSEGTLVVLVAVALGDSARAELRHGARAIAEKLT